MIITYVSSLCQIVKVEVVKCNELEMEFDLIGVNSAFANAIRRVLIAEVSLNFSHLLHYV